MRYLAQFSEAPRTGPQSFWNDAQATEAWLVQEGKQVASRHLTIRARSARALAPWLSFQTQPLMIDAWLDPMETSVTWTYLVEFLAEIGLERIWVPCGDDAWVGWSPQKLTIRATRESWLWSLAEDIWDPASWSDRRELEWWSDGRLQHAVRLPWGISEQRAWPTGWEEWVLSAEAQHLMPLWRRLADRLGTRPLRVRWRQEEAPANETVVGLRARYITCDLTATGGPDWLQTLADTPEPVHVRAQTVWSVPQWTEEWATVMTLRRVQRGTRLETTYTPRRPMESHSWRTLQRERRQIPILQIRPLMRFEAESGAWQRLEKEAESHRRQERLTHYLQSVQWPACEPMRIRRVRLPAGWTIKRWASQPGLWVIGLDQGDLEVHVEWPTAAHPGNIGIAVAGVVPLSMSSWVRVSGFKRLNRDRHYWAAWIATKLLDVLEGFTA